MNIEQKQKLIDGAKAGALPGVTLGVAFALIGACSADGPIEGGGGTIIVLIIYITLLSILGGSISNLLPKDMNPKIITPVTTALTAVVLTSLMGAAFGDGGDNSDTVIGCAIIGGVVGLWTGHNLSKSSPTALTESHIPHPTMPPPVPRVNYYLIQPGTSQEGPYDEKTILECYYAGTLSPDSLVWAEGMQNWIPLQESPLAHKLRVPATPPPPPATAPPTPPPAPATPPPSPFLPSAPPPGS